MIEHHQVHGRVVHANRHDGIVLALDRSGEEFKVPPFTGALEPAAPGEYRLRSTGEVVVDPDYTCTWSVRKPSVQ